MNPAHLIKIRLLSNYNSRFGNAWTINFVIKRFRSFVSKPCVIDLRSDTVTKPSETMRQAMLNSAVGDDGYGEDPTVNALEAKIASILGKQAAVFCPTGTMANLIAIMVHCDKRGSEALVGDVSHYFRSENGNAAHIAGVLLHPIKNNPDGTFDLKEAERCFRGAKLNEPVTSLVCIENTHNYCGGKALPQSWIDSCAALCRRHSIPLHMDGSRIFNAAEYTKEAPSRIARNCDSVNVCFSKGLAAPVGSALVGSSDFVNKARRMRKMLGGAWRQAGVLAAPALVALEEGVPLLGLDNRRAITLAKAINSLSLLTFSVDEDIHSNIVLVHIAASSSITADAALQRLLEVSPREHQTGCKSTKDEAVIVKGIKFGHKIIRFVLHRDISDTDLGSAIKKISFVFREIDVSN